MRTIKRIAAVAGASAVVVLGAATAAHADGSSSVRGASATFISYGDKFRVCDTSLDGYNAYVDYTYVRIDGSYQTGTHFVTTGNGTCGTFDHDFGEGRPVNFRACVQFPLGVDPCDTWRVALA
jgi:hypothetical protein